MIGHWYNAGAFRMIVAAQEILRGTHGHVAGRHGNVGIPAQVVGRIAAAAIIDAIVAAMAKWIRAHGAPGVIGYEFYVGREKRLIFVVHMHTRIGPPEKRLRKRRAIVEADFDFQIRAPWMQAYAMHAAQPVHRIVIAEPDGARTIGMFLDLVLHRQKSRRPVVLRPIELYSTGDPRSRQPD